MKISNDITASRIKIRGRVQGIGFRPFVYRLANELGLKGWILNDKEGVVIHIEGSEEKINRFLELLPARAPELAHFESLVRRTVEPKGINEFSIRQSESRDESATIQVQPDIATCDECLRELFDPADRRYQYPFINCTNCGPRFTIIRGVPYDRHNTTMSEFRMCSRCQQEYDSPAERRYHAQPNACWDCGPQVKLLTHSGAELNTPDPIKEAQRLLREGAIIAVKGLGGYHLACDALNRDAVRRLRGRKYREDKPFAVMMPDIETICSYCEINDSERDILLSYKRPIVLVRKRIPAPEPPIADDVAPRNPWLGVMLPYTPLHHLLFHDSGLRMLVMTSGNLSQEPIAYEDTDALRRLAGIADYLLVHNRKIQRRVDDSVVRIINGQEYILRRSRGYAPKPIKLASPVKDILAVGAELKNTFCFGKNNFAYLSHHLGDLENLETLSAFEQGIQDFKSLFQLEPRYVAYDLHPDYLSTKYALNETGLPGIGIQHHHAHIGSLLAEYGLDTEIIGIAFDGTGYGDDGTVWGGEVLIAGLSSYRRFATLLPVRMPGATRAIKEPWRMGATYLYSVFGEEMWGLDIPFTRNIDTRRWHILQQVINRGIHSPLTSSMGRLFDGISAILGVRGTVNYEGQAAMELEFLASFSKDDGTYPYSFIDEEPIRIDYRPLIEAVIDDITQGQRIQTIARRFHHTLASIVESVAIAARKQTGIHIVGLSGGCFQNYLLMTECMERLKSAGFEVLIHKVVPPNDGGVSLGQLLIANKKIENP
ncbi:carbamoyltransferase HypF [Candidatus Sumerlaeota bacterium]|nr:carbamoyltransferase HypF [Candidatus Sumerlaeota bacterium]